MVQDFFGAMSLCALVLLVGYALTSVVRLIDCVLALLANYIGRPKKPKPTVVLGEADNYRTAPKRFKKM
jgi:hypothetical protein